MDQEKLEYFRNLLQEKLKTLLSEAEKTLTDLTESGLNCPDPTDRAVLESDRGFELRIRDRERKFIRKIQAALEGIDEGTYGICEECGEEISLKRLEARPEASLCIECKRRQEQLEKIKGG